MRSILVLILFLIMGQLHAQTDKIFLKNGSRIRGIILNDSISDTISLEVSKAIVSIPITAIDEMYPHPLHNQALKLQNREQSNLFSTNIGVGIVAGKRNVNATTEFRPTLQVAELYHFHPLLNVGVGAGLTWFKDYTIVPVTFEYQALFGRSHRSWMTYGNVGYGFINPSEDYPEQFQLSGGMTYQFGLGWNVAQDDIAFQFRMGYVFQQIDETQFISTDYWITRKRHINRLTAQIIYQIKYR